MKDLPYQNDLRYDSNLKQAAMLTRFRVDSHGRFSAIIIHQSSGIFLLLRLDSDSTDVGIFQADSILIRLK